MEPDDYLPLSLLNQLEYCPRRFWLMYVHGEMAINAPVLEGIQRHAQAHGGGVHQEGDALVRRSVYVWSDRLRITGLADVVEERDGALVPIEYKRGRMGRWLNDHVQLCAQAICLQERTGQPVERGLIFYWRSRRRVEVDITPELIARTEATARRAFQMLTENRMPPPLDQRAKCRDCSLEGICLPREVLQLNQDGR